MRLSVKECFLSIGRCLCKLSSFLGQFLVGLCVSHYYSLAGIFLVAYVFFGNIRCMSTFLVCSIFIRDAVALAQRFPEENNTPKKNRIPSSVPGLVLLACLRLFWKSTPQQETLLVCFGLSTLPGSFIYRGIRSLVPAAVRSILVVPIISCFYWISQHDCLPHPLIISGILPFMYILYFCAINSYIATNMKKGKCYMLYVVNLVSLSAFL